MNDLKLAAKFREAAGVVRERGWKSGGWGWEGGPVCAEGALEVVSAPWVVRWFGHANPTTSPRTGRELKAVAAERLGQRLYVWNDNYYRTVEDVLGLFEGLAHDLELRYQIAANPSVLPAESIPSPIIPTREAVHV